MATDAELRELSFASDQYEQGDLDSARVIARQVADRDSRAVQPLVDVLGPRLVIVCGMRSCHRLGGFGKKFIGAIVEQLLEVHGVSRVFM